jgi:hypothetical protein
VKGVSPGDFATTVQPAARAGRHNAIARHGGVDLVTVNARRLFREPLEEPSRISSFSLRIGQRFAIFPRYECRNILSILVHQIEPIPEHRSPFSGCCLPERLECFSRGSDGFLGVFAIEFRTCANELACRGIVDFEGGAGGGGDEFTIDVAFFDEEGGVF